jgi:hypothetical protein
MRVFINDLLSLKFRLGLVGLQISKWFPALAIYKDHFNPTETRAAASPQADSFLFAELLRRQNRLSVRGFWGKAAPFQQTSYPPCANTSPVCTGLICDILK